MINTQAGLLAYMLGVEGVDETTEVVETLERRTYEVYEVENDPRDATYYEQMTKSRFKTVPLVWKNWEDGQTGRRWQIAFCREKNTLYVYRP